MLKYIKHVDGLRALAVIVVCLYHFNLLGFQGGFVGVDVFFVISGFLISRIISSEVVAGDFSFRRFYMRRIRRLLPAALASVFFVTIVGALLFSPVEFAKLGGSAAASLLLAANIYFFNQIGYFDSEKGFKPLLHFWSLSVEEQYYLIWPLLLVLLLKYRKIRPLVIALFVMSLVAAQYCLSKNREMVFYMMPFRFFEFGIGSALAWAMGNSFDPSFATRSVWKNLAREAATLTGIGVILWCSLNYTEASFPGLMALPPCLGAALVIYGGNARYSGLLLRNQLMLGIGLISYSLYLVHWPVYVFWRYFWVADPNTITSLALLAASVAIATAMYYLVEQPFRLSKAFANSRIQANFVQSCAALIILLAGLGIQIYQSGGWTWRIPKLSDVSQEFAQYFYGDDSCDMQRDGDGYGVCSNGKLEFSTVGDSHVWRVMPFFNSLSVHSEKTFRRAGSMSCRPEVNCDEETMGKILDIKNPNVIFAFHWTSIIRDSAWNIKDPSIEKFFQKFQTLMKVFNERGQKVWVFGLIPLHEISVSICQNRPINSEGCSYRKLPHYEAQAAFNRQFKQLVVENSGRFADVFAMLCDANGFCKTTYEGRPLYEDSNHFDRYYIGAYLMMRRKSRTFDGIFE